MSQKVEDRFCAFRPSWVLDIRFALFQNEFERKHWLSYNLLEAGAAQLTFIQILHIVQVDAIENCAVKVCTQQSGASEICATEIGSA